MNALLISPAKSPVHTEQLRTLLLGSGAANVSVQDHKDNPTEVLCSGDIDVVLVSWQGKGAANVVDRIKSGAYWSTPVIALIPADLGGELLARNAGADCYLTLPTNSASLSQTIRQNANVM